jgi:hypothetical protein
MNPNRIESIEMNVFHKDMVYDDKNVNIDEDDDAIDIAIDLDLDEESVLKRYLTLFKLLKKRKTKLLKKSNKYDKNNMLYSIVDFSVCYGLQGSKYVEEYQLNLQYLVLQAALILTITVPMYVSPPELTENEHFFSFFVGFSAFVHIVVIVSVTALTIFLNSPYTESETMIIRIETMPIYAAIMIGNYLSMIFFIAALLIAGFDRSTLDGALQTFVIILIICLIYSVAKILEKGNNGFQLDRALEFYKKYCESDGRLKPNYMKIALNDYK